MLPDNIVFAPIGVLVISAGFILGLRFSRPEFSNHWLIASSGALIAWSLMVVSRLVIPVSFSFPAWGSSSLFSNRPVILVDEVSWTFGTVLCTLILSSLLTEVARSQEVDWIAWVGKLLIGAVGLIAVFSGNPLTLILTWGAIDLGEMFILLLLVDGSRARERVVVGFSARTGGSMMLMVGLLFAGGVSEQGALSFTRLANTGAVVPAHIALILIIAAGLRLGVVPLHLPAVEEKDLRVGFGTVIRAISAVTGFILLVRVANYGLDENIRPFFLGLGALASIFAAISWLSSENRIDGRPYWLLGMASIALAAAVQGKAQASLAWAVAGLLPGGLLFLNSVRHPLSKILLTLGLISLTGLPFTPTWLGVTFYTSPFRLPIVFFLFSHSLLLLGFIKYAILEDRDFSGTERWIRMIYYWGLGLIPFMYFVIGWLEIRRAFNDLISLDLSYFWPGLVSIALLGLWIILYRRYHHNTLARRRYSQIADLFRSLLSLEWFYRLLWRFYRSMGEAVSMISSILEGNGGVLWTLLLMVLLFTFLAQNSGFGN